MEAGMDDELGGTWLERAVERAMAVLIESAPMRDVVVVPSTHGPPEAFDRQLHRCHELVFQSACGLLVRYFDGAEFMEGMNYGEQARCFGANDLANAGDGDQAEWPEGGVRSFDFGGNPANGPWHQSGEEGGAGQDGVGGSRPGDSELPEQVGSGTDAGTGGAGDSGDRGESCKESDVRLREMFFAITVQCSAGGGVQMDREPSGDGDTQAN